jgi:hypothetical protein
MRALTIANRRRLTITSSALAVLFLANAAVGFLTDPMPLGAMHAELEQMGGWKAANLSVKRGGYTVNLVSRSSYAEFAVRGQPSKTIYIEMKKPIDLLPWQLTQYRVEN